jgi:hypothetical protein
MEMEGYEFGDTCTFVWVCALTCNILENKNTINQNKIGK